MIKYGCPTNPSVDIIREIKIAKKFGFDFVEIGIEMPEGAPEKLIRSKEQILKLLKDFDTPTVAHTAWFMDLGSFYEGIRRAWISEGKKAIRVANKLGIKKIGFHLGSMMPIRNSKTKKQFMNNFVSSLKELVKYGKKFDVKVMLENCEPIGNFSDVNYMLKKVPDTWLNLDIGHAFIVGDMEIIEKYIKTFGKRIEHIHMHDNHGKSDEHLPIGKGTINYKKVVKLLKDAGYDKTITLEVFPKKSDAAKSREKIRKLWNK
jgi:sugar phosphate isomerase/epimerase